MNASTAYRELPRAALDMQRIEALWLFAPGCRSVHSVLPDGRMDLLVRFRLDAAGRIADPRLIVAGPAQRAAPLPTAADTALLGLRFHVGWGGRCLGLAPSDLRDSVLLDAEVRRLLGARATPLLRARTLPHLQAALSTLGQALAHAAEATPSHLRTIVAIRRLHASGGGLAIAALARTVGISPRSLRRDITDTVGLSAKTLASVVRFQHSLHLRRQHGQMSLAELACAAGYSDQAHMTREFRALGGFTPAATPDLPLLQLSL